MGVGVAPTSPMTTADAAAPHPPPLEETHVLAATIGEDLQAVHLVDPPGKAKPPVLASLS